MTMEQSNAANLKSFALSICEACKLGRIAGLNHTEDKSIDNPYPNGLDNPLGLAWWESFCEGRYENESKIFSKIFS